MKYSIASLSLLITLTSAGRLKATDKNKNEHEKQRHRNALNRAEVENVEGAFAEQIEDIFAEVESGEGIAPKIVGGANTGRNEYPYVVFAGTCGGSLIASNIVLTSARCGAITEVNIGRWKLDDPDEEYETFNVITKVPHPNYDPVTLDFDFMVVKLDGHSAKTPVTLDDGSNEVPKNTKLMIMGWGTNTENGTDGVNKLKDALVKKKKKSQCRDAYGSQVTDNNFCAKKTDKGYCNDSRDIGGPVVLQSDKTIQVGIISFVNEGQCSVQPVMLSKISAKYSWIEEQVNLLQTTSAPALPPVGGVTPAPITAAPIVAVTASPSASPIVAVTGSPVASPIVAVTASPSASPIVAVTASPIVAVTASPSASPIVAVTASPSASPIVAVTGSPVASPIVAVTASPSASPIVAVTASPSASPIVAVTASPSASPIVAVTASPSASPTVAVTDSPTASASGSPTVAVTDSPTASPSDSPIVAVTASPTASPTTLSSVVIPLALTKLGSAVSIIEGEL